MPDTPNPARVSGPTFIQLICRISGALIEMEQMLHEREGTIRRWEGLGFAFTEAELPPKPETLIPPEFSRSTFTDIAAKALRLQDAFDELKEASGDA